MNAIGSQMRHSASTKSWRTGKADQSSRPTVCRWRRKNDGRLNILSSPYKRCTRAEGEQKIALEVNTEYLNSARDRKSLTARAMCCPQVVAGLEGIECDCDEIARLKKKEPPVRGVSALLPFFSMCSSCPSFQVRSSSGFCCLASFWLPSNDVEDHLSSLRGSLNKVASAWKYGDLCSR